MSLEISWTEVKEFRYDVDTETRENGRVKGPTCYADYACRPWWSCDGPIDLSR